MRPETGVRFKLNRDDENEHQAPPENRHRETGKRDAHQGVIDDSPSSRRRDDTRRYPKQQREEHRAQRKLDRRRKEGQELLDHGLGRDQRCAEIAMREVAHVAQELLPDRPVEAVLMEQQRVPFGRDAALAGAHFDGIAGDEADRQEGQEGDREKGRDYLERAPEDEADHRRGPESGRRDYRPACLISTIARRRRRTRGDRAG